MATTTLGDDGIFHMQFLRLCYTVILFLSFLISINIFGTDFADIWSMWAMATTLLAFMFLLTGVGHETIRINKVTKEHELWVKKFKTDRK